MQHWSMDVLASTHPCSQKDTRILLLNADGCRRSLLPFPPRHYYSITVASFECYCCPTPINVDVCIISMSRSFLSAMEFSLVSTFNVEVSGNLPGQDVCRCVPYLLQPHCFPSALAHSPHKSSVLSTPPQS